MIKFIRFSLAVVVVSAALAAALGLVRKPGKPMEYPQPRHSSARGSISVLPDPAPVHQQLSDAVAGLHADDRSEKIRYLIGEKGDGSYAVRAAALRAISNAPTDHEIELLLAFSSRHELSPPLDRPQTAALNNDIFNLLRARMADTPRLARHLLDIASDNSRNIEMRDYALQHLSAIPLDDETTRGLGNEVEKILWRSAAEASGSVPGTALLALYRKAGKDKTLDQERLSHMALASAGNPALSPSTRATALQVSSLLGRKESLKLAQGLAQDDRCPPQLRAAAIATLGQLGGPTQRETLQQWSEHPDSIVATPAQSALRRLNQRHGL